MAMIHCRECGKEISDTAEKCPHCGAKTRYSAREKEKKADGILILVCIAVGCILVLNGLSTMMTDMGNYGRLWGHGYNYRAPLTEHEIGVIARIVAGALLSAGSTWALIKKKK